jgi:endonuclease YncB( thermonuclease family)
MPRRPPFLIGLLVVALIAAIGSGVHEWQRRPAGPPPPSGAAFAGRARTIDGDSLELGGRQVRLFGIDAPEYRQPCRDARGRAYDCGIAARDALADAIGRAPVSCTPVGESHSRDVAVCTADGRDLSEAMVRAGHAIELRQHSRGRYSDAEREARAARRGLWAGEFERPAQWRERHAR